MLRGWRRQENGGSEGDSFATWVEEEREEEMPSCAATKPRMQDMEDGPCCVARRERGGMAVRGNVCFYPTCLLLVLKTGAWHGTDTSNG